VVIEQSIGAQAFDVKGFDVDRSRLYAVGMRPARTPVGLHLNQAARSVSRAFDDALAGAGGSLPVWLVLLNLKANPRGSQRDIAEAIGVTEATLTHHLNAMDTDGLVTRRRDPANRRVHLLELTESGDAAFIRLRSAAVDFDRRLRHGIADKEIEQLQDMLDRLAANVGNQLDHRLPGPGLLPSGSTNSVTKGETTT
jgi:MarR family transcriptional regulator for hemolysin